MTILASDPHEAAIAQMLVLRCLGIALERLWRVRSRNSVDGHGRNIERVAIETKSLTPTEIITEQVNHYFDLAAVAASNGRAQDSGRSRNWPVGFVDAGSGIVFPYEVGWMHFDEAIANEPSYPGLGQTIQYAALGSKASIYVHDKNIVDFPQSFDPEFLAPEFDAAASDIFEYNANARSAGDRTLIMSSGRISYLRQDFEIDAGRSVLALTNARGKFFKIRATWTSEPFFDDIGNEFVDAVFDLLSTSCRLQ